MGVMVLTITMAIMTGFETELRQKVVGSAHIFVSKLGGSIHGWQAAKAKVEQVAGVSSVSAFAQAQVLLANEGRTKGLLIRGIEQESRSFRELSSYLKSPDEGLKLFNSPQQSDSATSTEPAIPGIIIGQELARNLLIFKNGKVSLLTPQVSSTPFGLVPRFKRFEVSAIYASGLTGYEEGLAFLSLTEAQKFFRLGDAVSGLEVAVDNIDRAPQIAQDILQSLGGVTSGFFVQDWTLANKELWEAIKLEKRVYFIVLLLIIVMASFSIISMLIMIVLEKRRDIAILKTLGARTSTIASIFRLQGAIIGGLGVILGTLAGYLGCIGLQKYGFPLPEKVFPTATLPVQIEHLNFAVVAVAAFVICLVSTWYPVRRAAAVEPVDVLRYE